MLKRIIGLGMLCMASHAYAANIVVTTTADEDVDDNQCSLREAVIFINLNKLNDVGENSDYHGCGGRATETENTYLPVIELAAGKTYTLTQGELVLNSTTTIQSSSLTDISDRNGGNNPVIQTKSPHRLFNVIDRSTSANTSMVVAFNQVDLKGCGAFGTCEFNSNGGLVLTNDTVVFTRLRLSGGRANSGGAVYLSSPLDGRVTFSEVEAFNNQAMQGSVLWLAAPNFSIEKSLIRNNRHPAVARPANDFGYALYINKANAVKPNDNTAQRTGFILSSTFYQNAGRAFNVVQNMSVLSNTIIGQRQGGVYFESSGLANFANNLVAGNSSRTTLAEDGNFQNDDCVFPTKIADDETYFNHNAFEFGCDRKDVKYLERQQKLNLLATDLNAERLIANQNDTNNEGVCDLPTLKGLLCPLRRGDADFTATLKPRLSLSYENIDQSPIVNQGKTGGQSPYTFSCPTSDQRGRSRVICDIGAVELIIPSGLQKNGKDIKRGEQQIFFDLTDVLADGQLLPFNLCSSVLNIPEPVSGWSDGCIQFTQEPKKGKALLNIDQQALEYNPKIGGFHGSDIFDYTLVTTTTRFSEAENDRVVRVQTTIVSEPGNLNNSNTGIESKTAGGSVGLGSLGGLLALAWLRRRMMGGK